MNDAFALPTPSTLCRSVIAASHADSTPPAASIRRFVSTGPQTLWPVGCGIAVAAAVGFVPTLNHIAPIAFWLLVVGAGTAAMTLYFQITIAEASKVEERGSALALGGLGWSVSANMTGQKWLHVVAIGAFAGAPALAWLAGDPVQYLAYAAALFLLMCVPGMVLMRKEPSDIV